MNIGWDGKIWFWWRGGWGMGYGTWFGIKNVTRKIVAEHLHFGRKKYTLFPSCKGKIMPIG